MKPYKLLSKATTRISLFATAALLAVSSLSAKPYQLDEYSIKWEGSMPVKTHHGSLKLKSLDIDISDEGEINSLKAVVDMTQIQNSDEEGKSKDKLIGHLSSEDFFYVDKYPTSEFELSEYKDGLLHGTLTIRGIEKHVALPAKVTGDPDSGWQIDGSFDYDREDYNVNYQNSGFFGAAKNKLIEKLIDINVSLTVKP